MEDEKELKQYDRWGVARPTHLSHGITDTLQNPLSEQIPKNHITKWRLEGNKLIATTDLGEVINYIPTDYILVGVENNLPILKKIVL